MLFATYNIQYGTGKDGRVDLARVVGELGAADVIALQEVDRFFARSGDVDQAAAIAGLMPDRYWVFGPGVDVDASFKGPDGRLVNRRRRFGNMLLSRWPILSSRNHLLPKDGMVRQMSVQRSAIEAVIAPPARPLRVYSVHLGNTSAPERARQIERLLEIHKQAPSAVGVISGAELQPHWLSGGAAPPMPPSAILMGDFNLAPDSREYEMLCGPLDPNYGRITTFDGLVDVWVAAGHDPAAGVTFVRRGHPERSDYMFVTADLGACVRSMRVDDKAVGSDHQPVFAEVEI